MTFVDTSVWAAIASPAFDRHGLALHWFKAQRGRVLTTDHMIGETLTLLRARGVSRDATRIGHQLMRLGFAQVEWTRAEQFAAAQDIFDGFRDKEWSFCDCLSYATIRRLGIGAAASYDRHFDQFGIAEVVRP